MHAGRLTRGLAASAVLALPLAGLAVPTSSTAALPAALAAAAAPARHFDRVATYPVFQNVPAGVDPADPTVAEISTVVDGGNTVVYTDALGKRIGFVDITDPANPVGDGTVELASIGNADDQPTSVAAVGDYVLVVIDESGGDFVDPSGRVDVIRVSDRQVVRSIDLGGQPDSIAVSADEQYAVIAMENQRDESFTPPGGEEGELPQLPAGSLQVLDLGAPDSDPAAWSATEVPFVEPDGDPLPAFAAAGLYAPEDPEPEYVDINDDDQVVVTLQENNGVVVVDLPTRTIEHVFSAGDAAVSNVDTTDDGIFNANSSIDVPREPDAVQWVGDGLVATANEGDLFGGSRGWSVFDVATGDVVWDSGNTFEQLAVAHGLFNDDRADNKGAEPEGMAFDVIGGVPTAFVGSERSNFVAVYDMTDPTAPQFRQVLPTTNGPEGLLPVPGRDLLVVSSEEDDAAVQVRATVGVYRLKAGRPAFPAIVSRNPIGAAGPIGWGALGALAAVPGQPNQVYAASDAAYATGRIYTIDTSSAPAVINDVLTVRNADGTAPALDIEGLTARPGGGFWLAVEGATGAANKLVATDADGVIRRNVSLPTAVSDHIRNWGLEGVAVRGRGASEQLITVVQRPLWVDPSVAAGAVVPLEGNVARIGRFDLASGTWRWFAYPLSTTTQAGDWIGLSEVTVVDDNTIAVIERDKMAGTRARIKRVYTVDLPAGSPSRLTPVTKRLAVDVLPQMKALKGWTQEKLEGLTISAGGQVFAVTDNDGVQDATGETQAFNLGSLKQVFGASLRTTTSLKVSPRTVRQTRKLLIRATVNPRFADGTVRILDRRTVLRTLTLRNGTAAVRLRLKPGRHVLRAIYSGDADAIGSGSAAVKVLVKKSRRR